MERVPCRGCVGGLKVEIGLEKQAGFEHPP
jgi:hypothetical protein